MEIRVYRLRAKLSTAQVAKHASLNSSTVDLIEAGSPLVAIGAYLNVLEFLGGPNVMAGPLFNFTSGPVICLGQGYPVGDP